MLVNVVGGASPSESESESLAARAIVVAEFCPWRTMVSASVAGTRLPDLLRGMSVRGISARDLILVGSGIIKGMD